MPDVGFDEVRAVAGCVRDVLAEHGLVGFPKTSGLARHPRQRAHRPRARLRRRSAAPRSRSRARSSGGCPAARRASGGRRSASASSSTTTRTRATARSPPPTPSARSPTPASRARSTGTSSIPSTRRRCGSTRCRRGCATAAIPSAAIDDAAGSLDGLLELAARDKAAGLGDAPWPPNFPKSADEGPRVQPSRARRPPG